MKPSKHRLVCFLGAGLLSGIASVTADVKENPYQAIVDRNAFGLKPPPPPPDTTAPIIPTQQATVELTGITSILSKKKALLEITEPGPGKTPKKPIMEEGDRIDSIEVISIDVEKSQVRIRNSGVESNLTFKVTKSSPAPGTPAPPGPAALPVNPGAAAPTIISSTSGGTASDRSGVTLLGGGAQAVPPAAGGTAALTALGGTPSTTPNFGAAATLGLRTIPSRQIRTETSSAANPSQKPMSPEEAIINLELQREQYRGKGFPPLPPTLLNPTAE